MALNFNQVKNLLLKNKSGSSLANLMLEYSTLKQKLDTPENQTWYFKKAIESKRHKLSSLSDEYNRVRQLSNKASIDYFIHRINENNIEIASRKGNEQHFNQRMIIGSLVDQNEFFTELIRLKSKTASLMPIDYYLEHPNEFLMFIE